MPDHPAESFKPVSARRRPNARQISASSASITYDVERVGIFTYSPEEGTRAQRLGDPVPKDVKDARAEELRRMHDRLAHQRSRSKIGSLQQCLVEGISNETDLLLQGRTWDQAPEVDGILYVTSGEATAGEIHTVRIVDARGHDLFGELQ